MKKMFVLGCGGILVLVVLVAIVAISTGGSSKSGSGGGKGSSEIHGVVGTPFKLGDFQYTITGFSQQQSIGNQFTSETPSSGATFLIVSYSIENQGNETATAMSSDFYLTDASNRKFETSSKAQTALSMVNKSDLLVTQLQPGIVKQAQQVFEVPLQVVQSGGLNLVVPEKGFGSGKAVVPVK